ncbi:hypothetical protein QKT26_gp28 [Carcinus maenas nudivirus]|uniref:Uncharacterized protein n=1 Tax=Carcinus maenas nudivirus TaxID=2880837 RepID=A0AAE9BZB7_9VIRU|nr:hypothetical protein QKT26_gp28 [Carcinus maenas nudivirus]UBZ25618.1 hypothetical protein CmNV_028 [Carcinus maenas nudivirus]
MTSNKKFKRKIDLQDDENNDEIIILKKQKKDTKIEEEEMKFKPFVNINNTMILRLDYLSNFKILASNSNTVHTMHEMSSKVTTEPIEQDSSENLVKIKMPVVCSLNYNTKTHMVPITDYRHKF